MQIMGVANAGNMAQSSSDAPGLGSGGDEENPFSFKSFIKRSSSTGPGADNEGKGTRKVRDKTKSKKSSSLGNEGVLPFPEEEEENPFSFKKFVKKQAQTGIEEDNHYTTSAETTSLPHPLYVPPPPTLHPPSSAEGGRERHQRVPPSSSSSFSFQHDSRTGSIVTGKLSEQKKRAKTDNLFNDSDSVSDREHAEQQLPLPLPLDSRQHSKLGESAGEREEREREEEEEEEEDEREEEKEGWERAVWDAGRLSDSSDEYLPTVTETKKVQSVDQLDLKKLASENKRLKSELEKYRDKFTKEKQRSNNLREQLHALKKKEAEETKALEDIVAKVEENLVATTKRAVSAEAIVGQLKQEVKNLQSLIHQADAQSVHQHYEEVLSGVRAKATFASKQLAMTSMAAEQSLRELMSGAESLRNVAEVLQFIDRISEVRQH